MKITKISAFEILDSRGKPTIKTFVKLSDGSYHSSSVPSGASTGKHEAVELRDHDKKRQFGLGVLGAIKNINEIINKTLRGKDVKEPKKVDEIMIDLDGTDNKAKLGANAILSVSQAVLRAAATCENLPLWQFINQYYLGETKPAFPRLMVNIINGGKHANWNFDIQEFMISPKTNLPSSSVRIAAEIFHQLGKNLKKNHLSTLVGDEGGYSPFINSNEEVLETIIKTAGDCGYRNLSDFNLCLDSAASEFFDNGRYVFKKTNQRLTGQQLIKYYLSLHQKFFILSFEDPFAEDDWEGFKLFTKMITRLYDKDENNISAKNADSSPCRARPPTIDRPLTPTSLMHGREDAFKQKDPPLVVGDDLYVTNPKRIKRGIAEKTTNAVLIKPNQIGTISETIEAISLAKKASWKIVVSHRSGETEDSFIADLAYGVGADFIKTGSTCRSERLAKYNRLIEIEHGF